jgi:anti-sigma-K factor RskA
MTIDERHPGANGHDELRELARLAPLGALLPDEQRRVALHAAEGCEECSAALREGDEALEVLALSAPPLAPSPRAREALLGSLGRAPVRRAPGLRTAPRRRESGQRFAAVAAGLALALSAASLALVWRQTRDTQRALDAAEANVSERIAAEAQSREALAARVGSFEQTLEARVASSVSLALAGDASFGAANARVVMDAAGQQVLLLASRIPPLPAGRTYQLWVIVSGSPRSLGVFAPDPEGRVVYVGSEPLELPTGVKAAISIEPAGGVPQPTGPIVLVSR